VAHAIWVQREAAVEEAIEADRSRPEQTRRAEERVVPRTLH
jgi:hypothetical protein